MTTYLFLAEGFEEIEALTPVDLLRRAGIDIMTVAVGESRHVTGAHGVTIEADLLLDDEDMSDAEMLIAPGGMPGAKNLADSPKVCALFKAQAERGAYVAAICAAPAVLLAPSASLTAARPPAIPVSRLLSQPMAPPMSRGERVVRDGNIITSNGPSSAIPFALALIEALRPGSAAGVAAGILC